MWTLLDLFIGVVITGIGLVAFLDAIRTQHDAEQALRDAYERSLHEPYPRDEA